MRQPAIRVPLPADSRPRGNIPSLIAQLLREVWIALCDPNDFGNRGVIDVHAMIVDRGPKR